MAKTTHVNLEFHGSPLLCNTGKWKALTCNAAGSNPTADNSDVLPPTQSNIGNRSNHPSILAVLSNREFSWVIATPCKTDVSSNINCFTIRLWAICFRLKKLYDCLMHSFHTSLEKSIVLSRWMLTYWAMTMTTKLCIELLMHRIHRESSYTTQLKYYKRGKNWIQGSSYRFSPCH